MFILLIGALNTVKRLLLIIFVLFGGHTHMYSATAGSVATVSGPEVLFGAREGTRSLLGEHVLQPSQPLRKGSSFNEYFFK